MTNQSPIDSLARRPFLSRIARYVLGASAVALPMPRAAIVGRRKVEPEDWMASLKGRHRTVFDVSLHRDGKPLTQAKNFLDAWTTAFHASPSDINLVVGVHGDGLPLLVDDGIWAKYPLAEEYAVRSAADGDVRRNPFIESHARESGLIAPDQSVEALQRRGAIFVICNNTIRGAAQRLAAKSNEQPRDVEATLHGHLLPDVKTVPAMVVALAQLQEHGLTYVKVA